MYHLPIMTEGMVKVSSFDELDSLEKDDLLSSEVRLLDSAEPLHAPRKKEDIRSNAGIVFFFITSVIIGTKNKKRPLFRIVLQCARPCRKKVRQNRGNCS